MLKVGCVMLSLWGFLNLIASLVVVLIPVVLTGKIAPALLESLNGSEIDSLTGQILNNANGIAVFANGVNVAFCILLLFAIWGGLYRKVKWVFWAILTSLTVIVAAGTAADYVAGLLYPEVNVISGCIIGLGLILVALTLFKEEDA